MAKSKSGGTRSYIRGRVGSDVYSIGKDAKGKKQQVVRSLAETVANPQTLSQMRGRMIMSTIMQVVSQLKPIIDHSFDGISGKQPNISEFIAQNYALVKADVAAHPSTGNVFGLNMYGEKGAKQGAYVISQGKAALPSALVLTQASGVIAITLPSDNITIAGLKAALDVQSEEFFTLVGISTGGSAAYERFSINDQLADDTAISAANLASVFVTEGNVEAELSIASNVISITLGSVANCCAVIISKKTADGFIHNKAVLGAGASLQYASDTALPTYPVGDAAYLNGGDLFGGGSSFNPGGGDTPTPSPTQRSVTAATVNGAALSASGSANLQEGANAIVATIPTSEDEETYQIGIATKASYPVGHAAPSSGMQNVTGTTANLSVTAASGEAARAIILCKAGVVIQSYGTLNAPAAPQPGTDVQLTACQFGMANMLTDLDTAYTEDAAEPSQIAYTFDSAPSADDHVKLVIGDNVSKQVGDSLPSGNYLAYTPDLTQASGNSNYTYSEEGNGRLYLVKGNTVIQVLRKVNISRD